MTPLPTGARESDAPTELQAPDLPLTRLTVAAFPGAGIVHLFHALDSGAFGRAGLDVNLVTVTSSDQQLAGWRDGAYDLLHTSPDHLLRESQRDPVAVRVEGMGELAVHRRPGDPRPTDRWAVDDPHSAYALVLRAILADVAGLPVSEGRLVPVGGTVQRYDALREGSVDGTTLHAPFDVLAADDGYPRVGGHLEALPDLVTNVVVAPRATAAGGPVRAYLEVCRTSTAQLLAAGAPGIETALVRHGWTPATARAAAPGLLGPAGLSTSPELGVRGLEVVAALRRRFVPDWRPARPLPSLIGP